MRLLINIPKEFEQHFQADRFEDSLRRLGSDAHFMAGLYEQETALMLIDAFKNAVVVPPHGRWIKKDMWSVGVGMGESYGYYYKCSECGHRVQGDYNKCGYNFCPYCGADMKEES